jgi:hypothetical protein
MMHFFYPLGLGASVMKFAVKFNRKLITFSVVMAGIIRLLKAMPIEVVKI